MCNYEGVVQQMHGKSRLQIIHTKRQYNHSGHVIDALGKTKEKH